MDRLHIVDDDKQGTLSLSEQPRMVYRDRAKTNVFHARIEDPAEPGDQTVPVHSADAVFRSGKAKGVFRQTGYEHQASYQNEKAMVSTLYCICKIALEMKWSQKS